MKKQQGSYRSSLQFLQTIRSKINNLGNNPLEGTVSCLKEITKRMMDGDHVALIVALHNDNYLQRLLKIAKEQNQQKRNDDIEKNVAIILIYADECFLKLRNNYKPFLEYFRPRLEKYLDERTYKDYGKEDKRYEAIDRLLKKFQLCNNQKQQPFARGKSLNEFVATELAKEQPILSFQECVFTWIHIQIENALKTIVKQREKIEPGFCCSLHFEENGNKRQVQTNNQNFAKQLPSLPNRRFQREDNEAKDIMKRQVVSYLNSEGGIYYIGIEHTSQKEARFVGVTLTQKDREDFLKLVLNDVVQKIFPSQDQNEDEDEKQEEARLQKFRQDKEKQFSQKTSFYKEYEINRYVSVDFIPVYQPKFWFYSRLINAGVEYLNFIIRIKVKQGDEYEVYHFINQKDIPEAYFRDNNKEKKLSMIDYYNEVYRRLKEKANQRHCDPPKVHALCRFVVKVKENK